MKGPAFGGPRLRHDEGDAPKLLRLRRHSGKLMVLMKHLTEYRDKDKVRALAAEIARVAGGRKMTFMEVCGTHTMSIARFGLKSLLPGTIKLISGPGCPVCVTPNSYLDHAIAIARQDNITICTFGDMIRVPGSASSLEKERAAGRDIRIVYSTLDALEIARQNKDRQVVFLGVGFETTAPTIAASIITAAGERIENYSVLSANKAVPPALLALISGPLKLDGFLLPGHVSTIIGAGAYREILERGKVAGAIAGFEPTDILEGILNLAGQVVETKPLIHISYSRAVTEDGNKKALAIMNAVFEPSDAEWRGLGSIPGSGLAIRDGYCRFDAAKRFRVSIEPAIEPKGCICGRILSGLATPADCPLFGKACRPEHPVGACMVSTEGTCAAYYKYGP